MAESPTRARDHLANERTWLAWLRTAVAVMALGLAIAGFGNGTDLTSDAAGAVLVVVGAVGVGYGTGRYRAINRQIEQDTFVTGSRGRSAVWAASILVAAIGVAMVLLVIGR